MRPVMNQDADLLGFHPEMNDRHRRIERAVGIRQEMKSPTFGDAAPVDPGKAIGDGKAGLDLTEILLRQLD